MTFAGILCLLSVVYINKRYAKLEKITKSQKEQKKFYVLLFVISSIFLFALDKMVD